MRRLLRADLIDDARAGDLNERAIAGAHKMCVGAVISHCAIIHDVGASVWAEPEIGGPVEPANIADKRLVAGVVAGKPTDLQGERLIRFLVEVDQLDLVPDFGGRCGGIRRRESEIPLKNVEGGTAFYRPFDK